MTHATTPSRSSWSSGGETTPWASGWREGSIRPGLLGPSFTCSAQLLSARCAPGTVSGRGDSNERHRPGVLGSGGAADCSPQCKRHKNTINETEGVRHAAVTDSPGARDRCVWAGVARRPVPQGRREPQQDPGPGAPPVWAPLLRDLQLPFSPAEL